MITLLAVAGCSLSTTEVAPCQSNLDCRTAFGWGSVCGGDGLCVDMEPSPRCDRTIPADLFENRAEYRDAILLGSVYERTESLNDVKSFELAVTQVNDGEGLEGRSYAFVQCSNEEDAAFDDLTFDEANVAMAVSLADEVGVPAILGPSYSSTTQAAYDAVGEFGTLVISPSATSPSLTDLDQDATDEAPGLLWRTAPPDSIQGRAIALDLNARGIDRLAIIYQAGPYGEYLAQVVVDGFEGTTDLLLFDNATLRDTHAADAGNSNAQEVLFVSSDKSDVTAFLNAAGAVAGYHGKGLFLTDAAYDVAILDNASAARDLFPNVRGTRPSTPSGPVYDTFLAAYAAQYGESAADSAFTAYAYDAAWLVIFGTAWAQYQEDGISGTGIARGLRHVSSGPEVLVRPTSWNTVKSSFQSGASIDVAGASGALDFDPVDEETTAPIDVWTVKASGNDFDVACTFDPGAVATLPPECLPI